MCFHFFLKVRKTVLLLLIIKSRLVFCHEGIALLVVSWKKPTTGTAYGNAIKNHWSHRETKCVQNINGLQRFTRKWFHRGSLVTHNHQSSAFKWLLIFYQNSGIELISCKLLQNIYFVLWFGHPTLHVSFFFFFCIETFKTTEALIIEGDMLGIIRTIPMHQLQGCGWYNY